MVAEQLADFSLYPGPYALWGHIFIEGSLVANNRNGFFLPEAKSKFAERAWGHALLVLALTRSLEKQVQEGRLFCRVWGIEVARTMETVFFGNCTAIREFQPFSFLFSL